MRFPSPPRSVKGKKVARLSIPKSGCGEREGGGGRKDVFCLFHTSFLFGRKMEVRSVLSLKFFFLKEAARPKKGGGKRGK